MKIRITFEVDEEERKAIASCQKDFEDLDVDPAGEREVQAWARWTIREAISQALETFKQGGIK
jgi:hypothetical protein